jgi:hypothetical protein
MMNYALIAGGLFAVALGGWRMTHSEAPSVEWTQELIERDDYKNRAVDGNWSARSYWSRGVLEYVDDTEANPDAENWEDREWIGSRVEIRAKPYWAWSIWPRTWVWVELSFPKPDGIKLYHIERGEKRYYQAKNNLGAVITIDETKFIIPVKRAKINGLPYDHPNPSKRMWRKKWYWYVRRSDVDAGGGMRLREGDARKFIQLLREKPAGKPIRISVEYFQRDRDIEEGRIRWRSEEFAHEFEITAPPESIWAAFPELTYWPWQEAAA